MSVQPGDFGKDHWSVFAYVETRCVDHKGVPEKVRMRCSSKRHPQHEHGCGIDAGEYPTRLRGGVELQEHDDWDCVDDLQAAGLLKIGGTPTLPKWELTDKGFKVAAKLRKHLAKGGFFADFPGMVDAMFMRDGA